MRQRRQRRSRPPTAGGDDADAGAHGELKLCRRPQDLVANTSPTTTGSMSSSSAHGRSTGWGGHLLVSLVSPFWTARGEHVGGLRKWRRAGGSSRVLASSSNSCLACYGRRRRRSCTYVFTVLKLCTRYFALVFNPLRKLATWKIVHSSLYSRDGRCGVVGSVKEFVEVANMIEVADATRQNKNVC
nr:uncharacterized protein LOC127295466 [Lolium perenne]